MPMIRLSHVPRWFDGLTNDDIRRRILELRASRKAPRIEVPVGFKTRNQDVWSDDLWEIPDEPYYVEHLHRQRCKACWYADGFNFSVPEEVWLAVVPPELQSHVVCLSCFDDFAIQKGVDYQDRLDGTMYFAGNRTGLVLRIDRQLRESEGATTSSHDDNLGETCPRQEPSDGLLVFGRGLVADAEARGAAETRESIAVGLERCASAARRSGALTAGAMILEAAAKVRARQFEDRPDDTTSQPRGHDANIHAREAEAGPTLHESTTGRIVIGPAPEVKWYTYLTDAQITEAVLAHTAPGSDVEGGVVEVPEGYLARTAGGKLQLEDVRSTVKHLETAYRITNRRAGDLELALISGLNDLRARLAALESPTQPRTLDPTTSTAKKV